MDKVKNANYRPDFPAALIDVHLKAMYNVTRPPPATKSNKEGPLRSKAWSLDDKVRNVSPSRRHKGRRRSNTLKLLGLGSMTGRNKTKRRLRNVKT
jgi:hypothetical protein